MKASDPRVAIAAAGLALAAAAACVIARSEDSVRAEFKQYVAGANQCTESRECVFAYPGCPLGCFVAVRTDRRDDVERKAKDLISQYEAGGRGCSYDCAAPTGVICLAGRCTEGNAQPGNPDTGTGGAGGDGRGGSGSGGSVVLGTGGAAGNPGGGPIATAFITFTPSDGATATDGMDLGLSISDPGSVVGPGPLEPLRSSVVLVTWPDKHVVPATVTVTGAGVPAGTKLLVAPAATLGAGWYALALSSLGEPFVTANALPDGTPGVRFHPASLPRVRALDICMKDAPGSKLLVLFSEPVVYPPSTGTLVSLTIDGAPSPCEVYDAQPDALSLTCVGLTATSRATVAIGAGIQAASQVALAPATFAVDVAALPAASCREFVTPVP